MARIEEPGAGVPAAPETFEADCPAATDVLDWVYITGPKSGKYQVDTVDPDSPAKVPAAGIVISKPSSTEAIVQYAGTFKGVSGLTPRLVCYVDTDGTTIQSPPGTAYEQPVAVAIDVDEIIVRPHFFETPVPVYASHLGTTDGATDARLPFPSGTDGLVSEPTSPGTPFYSFSQSGDWADGSNHPGTRSASNTVTTPGDVTELDVGTVLRVRFLRYQSSGGSEDIIDEETIDCDGTDQVSTPNGYLETLGVALNVDRYEGQVRVNVPLTTLLANGGYLRVLVEHLGGGAGFPYSDEWEIFVDGPYGSPPTPGVPTVVENTPNLVYLSGIRFYGIGSTFDIAGSISDVFEAMFHSSPALLDLDELGISGPSSISYTDADVTPSHPPYPVWDDGFAWLKTLAIDLTGRDYDAIINQRGRDPFNTSSPANSASGPIMTERTTPNSTDTDEQFNDEDYRAVSKTLWSSAPAAPPTGADKFDSTLALDNATNDGAQVYGGELIYPVTDFLTPASRRPVQQAGTDYSLMTSTRDYQRPFQHDTSPNTRANIVIYLPGFDVTTIATGTPDIDPGGSGDINMYLMLPGVSSVWFDMGREFFSAQFPTPEPGCIVKSLSGVAGGFPTNEYFYCSFGPFSTIPADRIVIFRIDMLTSSAQDVTRARAYNWT